MPLVEWDESFSVNINLIDRQHKKLFRLANEYHQALVDGKSKFALYKLLDGLAEYTAIHFSTEERYFAEFNFEDVEEHKRQHKVILDKTNELIAKAEVGVGIVDDEISKFLQIWLQGHIKGTDPKYVKCFHKNGLK